MLKYYLFWDNLFLPLTQKWKTKLFCRKSHTVGTCDMLGYENRWYECGYCGIMLNKDGSEFKW